MRTLPLALVLGFLTLTAGSPAAYSADMQSLAPGKKVVRGACGPNNPCVRLCPDGYSCYPLYGAYGPYGGTTYWGAYTLAGWGQSYRK